MMHSILIVDDNPINIKVLMDSLTKAEYKLLSATSGDKALMLAEKVGPDLILLDVNMPRMNGYETCIKLKENEKTKDIPVIFLSALSEVGNKVHGFNVGAVDYITKPFQKEEVLVRVQTQIRISELYKETLVQKSDIYALLHILSHDILNQVMLVDVTALMLSNELQAKGKIASRLETIQNTTKNISELIDKVRGITQVDEGKVQLKLSPVKIKDSKTELLTVFEHRLDEKHLTLEFEIDEHVSENFINVDPIVFYNTVLNNIISNAIKFSFENNKIQLIAYQDDHYSYIVIQDFGIGMNDVQLNRIFKTNEHTTTRGTHGERGTGYGMPLVKRYTEIMNGQVFVESFSQEEYPKDHGTKVTLRFPLVKSAPE